MARIEYVDIVTSVRVEIYMWPAHGNKPAALGQPMDYIDAPYRDIVRAFGKPNDVSDNARQLGWSGRVNGLPFAIQSGLLGIIKGRSQRWNIMTMSASSGDLLKAYFTARVKKSEGGVS